MAAHLFANSTDQRAVLEALTPLLDDEEHKADRDGVLGEPPPLVITAPVNDWVAISGLRGWVDNLPWAAERVSAAACANVVISCEVIGHSYRMRHSENKDGEQTSVVRSPDADWDTPEVSAMSTGNAPMPLYRDVEQLAFAMLLDHGIPARLALMGTRPFECPEDELVDLGQAIRLSQADRTPKKFTLRVAPYEGISDAPVLVSEASRDFGLTFFDDRYVEGRPSEQSMRRLLQLEQKIGERARRLYGAEAQLTLTYYNGAFQDELDSMLRANDRHVAVATERRTIGPWWQFWRHIGRFK